jgi:hypothetical protein
MLTGNLPSDEEVMQVAFEVSRNGPATASRLLGCVECGSSSVVSVEVKARQDRLAEIERFLGLSKCDQEVGVEVLDERIGSASAPGGHSYESLDSAEESLEFVGRPGDPRIVEAVDEMRSVTFGQHEDVIDEGGGFWVRLG